MVPRQTSHSSGISPKFVNRRSLMNARTALPVRVFEGNLSDQCTSLPLARIQGSIMVTVKFMNVVLAEPAL